MVESNNTVVFSKNRSFIRNDKTGSVTELKKVNGTYEFDIRLQNKSSNASEADAKKKLNAISEDVERLLGQGNPFQGLAIDEY